MPHIIVAIALLAAEPAATPPPPPAPPACGDVDHAALDFWVGDWTVSDTRSATTIAKSRVEKIMDGCALKETFEQTVGPGNRPIKYSGSSYTAFNNADRTWRQFYVDTAGAALSYSGKATGQGVTLEARASKAGTRMVVARQPDGSVRQTGETTRDGGMTWTPGYDFTYRRQ